MDKGDSIEEAIDKATDECIRNGILEQLLRDNRGEVRSMLLPEYDEQAHIEYEKEISYEEGKVEGLNKLSRLIQLLLASERLDDIDKVTKDNEYRERLMKEFHIE